jgi:hypothetical protein
MRDSMALPVATPMNIGAYIRLSAMIVGNKITVRCKLDVPTLPGLGVLTFEDPWDTQQTLQARPRLFASDVNVAWDHVALYKLGTN